jgi:hypothetical protein
MAKAKQTGVKRRVERPADERKTSISVPEALWQRVKIACIKRNTSFRGFLIEALEQELQRGGRA